MSQVYLIHGVSQVCCFLIDFLSGCFILCWTWDLKDSFCHFLSKSSIDKFLQLSFGKSFSLFRFWRTVLPHISLLVGSFFLFCLWPFEYIILVPSELQGFYWEICSLSYEESLMHDESLLSHWFHNCLCLWTVWLYSVLGCSHLELSYLGFMNLDFHFSPWS